MNTIFHFQFNKNKYIIKETKIKITDLRNYFIMLSINQCYLDFVKKILKEGKETYKEVLKRQYRDLIYTIENEDYDGDTAKVTVKITVYDLYKAQKDASEYLSNHPDEFLTDGEYDNDLYMDYKLEQMRDMNDTVSYNIVFNVTKTDGKWYVEQPSDEVLEKIHGVYNYEED